VEKSETNSTVQEQPGIFQLIDQLETAVDKILERQVPVVLFIFPIKTIFFFCNLGQCPDSPCSFFELKKRTFTAEKCFLCELGPIFFELVICLSIFKGYLTC
jgi:hypothetical protein